MKTPRKTVFLGGDRSKLLRTGLLVLALVLQGYLAQVHHHDFASAQAGATGAVGGAESPVQPVDSNGRDLHCFICHLSGHGSTSVLPPPVVLATALASTVLYRVAHEPLRSRDAPAAYSSRAPPSLSVQA